MDGYHAVVTSSFFSQSFPSAPSSLIPWSWNASRIFLALLLLLSYRMWRREQDLGEAGVVREKTVFAAVGGSTVLIFCFFAFVPLPRAYYPEYFFGRPEEFVAAALFAAALAGYYKKGDWRLDPFENMIVVSLIIGLISQAVFMSRSFILFDAMFDSAHWLKVVSYAVVLAGLPANTYKLYVRAEQSAKQSADANQELQQELAARKQAEEQLRRSVEDLNAEKRLSQQRAEELQQVNAELEQFAYSASHDLKEPVRNLVSYSTLLREDLGDELSTDVAADLDYIRAAATRMSNLVDGMLALSRTGRSSIKNEVVALEDCVTNSLEARRTRLIDSGAQVNWDRLPSVSGDAFLLTQLYQNLLANAMKFVDRKQPDIRLTAERDGADWVLGVKDNGIGIEPEYAEQVFVPFRRLHGMTEYEGTGIGLALCRKTVERHGGKIWVESIPGQGSHFGFTLRPAEAD